MKPLRTPRLVIRNITATDGDALAALIADYGRSPYAAYDAAWPKERAALQAAVDWFAQGDDYLAVCHRNGGSLIGFLAFPSESGQGDQCRNLGFIFHSSHHGCGYATEACHAVLAYGFGALGTDRVVTGTATKNGPSRRLLARLEFRVTGESTGSFRTAADGTPVTFAGCTYELTRDEWLRAQAGASDAAPATQAPTA